MRTTTHKSTRVAYSHYEDGDVPLAVDIARFRGQSGVEEIHLTAQPTRRASFDVQLEWLCRGCRDALKSIHVDDRGAVLRRFFCSNLSSQVHALEACPFSNPANNSDSCAVSWLAQPPPGPAEVALWAYHIRDPGGVIDKRRLGSTLALRRGRLEHYWTPGITSPGEDTVAGQTWSILSTYETLLHRHGLSVAGNLIRTWFLVRNIETDYGKLVDSRRKFFLQRGLTPHTHYVASTGIGGECATTAAKVSLDAYAIAGVLPEQVAHIRALDHMCRTDLYGVTFERATTVAYRDRTHVLISGTASINDKGDVLYPGDVSRQLTRTLENIDAILTEAGASAEDLCILVAYLRNVSNESAVRHEIRNRFSNVPLVIVAAPVCRPAWLVEVEGQAIVPVSRASLPPF